MAKELDKIGEWVAAGNLIEARRELERLKISDLPRKEMLLAASLARKADVPAIAVSIFAPIVRPKDRKDFGATDMEKASYAGALIKLGAVEEGLDILNTLSPAKAPESLLFKAHAFMFQWNYGDAITPLLELLKNGTLSEQEILLGKVNLAACYLFAQRWNEAANLLEELRSETSYKRKVNLYGISLELSAQLGIFQKDWAAAHRYLSEAETLFLGSETVFAFFVKKWQVVLNALEDPKSKKANSGFLALRAEALKLKHWESVRDCDFWRAMQTSDSRMFTHLYFGTPFEAFRKRIVSEAPIAIDMPDEFEWNQDKPGAPGKRVLSVLTEFTSGDELLGCNSRLQRVLSILASDFYRPFRVGVLHARLYPGEFYNPDSSPVRVRQAIAQLRKVLKEKRIPIEIATSEDGYRLVLNSGVSLKVRNPLLGEKGERDEMFHLYEKLKDKPFIARDVEKLLNVSRSSANRLLKDGIEDGSIQKSGVGSNTIYLFSSHPRKKEAA